MKIAALISLFVAASIAFAQKNSQRTDFLVIADPQAYTILDQYQQPLSQVDKTKLGINVPFQIVKSDETLGDQITRAMEVQCQGKTYFLQKDEQGTLAGGNTRAATLRGCTLVGDTVEILRDKTAKFIEGNLSQSGAEYLAKGETVLRVFEFQQRHYVRRAAGPSVYGWCSLTDKSAWRSVVAAGVPEQTGLTLDEQDRIRGRIDAANKTYRDYFEHFNRTTGQDKSIPSWHCEFAGSEVHCTLSAPYDRTGELRESTQYLVQELEGLVLGRHYTVSYDTGQITLGPRDAQAASGAGAKR